MLIRTALAALLLATAHAAAAPAISTARAVAIARAALPGSHATHAELATACNTPYWFVNLTRGTGKFLVLASAEGKVLRITTIE